MQGVKLDLISDIGIHQFIEKGIRGGVSYVAKKHSKSITKYLKSYDCNKSSKCSFYGDANNLYG